MPCDTPPPPSELDNMNSDENIEELDEAMYDFIDADELEGMGQEEEEEMCDDSMTTFQGHSQPVFTCNFDKTRQYVATGSQDETALVLNVSPPSVKFKCEGHKDSVIFADFSPDSKYMASADMSGFIQVFDMDSGTVVWSFEAYEFTWIDWLHGSNVLVAGSIDGSSWKWSIPDGATSVYENSGTSISTGAISNNDEKLCVGCSNGTLKFWDLTQGTSLGSLSGSAAFKAPVTDIKFSPDNALVIAASEDGILKLVKMSDFKVLFSVAVCDNSSHNHPDVSVETVGFCHNPSFVAAGTNCGVLNVYDISSKTKRWGVSLHSAVVKSICDDSAPLLYAALAEGDVQAYDTRTGNLLKTWTGHTAAILDLAISSDRSLLLTSSDDCSCKIFEKGSFHI